MFRDMYIHFVATQLLIANEGQFFSPLSSWHIFYSVHADFWLWFHKLRELCAYQ